MKRVATGLCAAVVLWSAPAPLPAQYEIAARGASIRLGGILQAGYGLSSVEGATDDFASRRVRLTADVTLNDFVSGRVQPDFAGGQAALQDTYVRLTFSPGLRLWLGQFKREFDLFEQPAPQDMPLIELDGRVRGYSACAGVGSVCSHSRFTQRLGLAGRDQGVRVDGTSGRVRYGVSVTNGTGINVGDENDAKSVSSRVSFAATDNVRVAGQLAVHDYVDSADESASALGWGADVEVGTWREGLHFMGSVVGGENWRAARPAGPPEFLTLQAMATYYHPLVSGRVAGVEPLARLAYGDPDTGTSDDAGLLFTPGVMFYLQGRTRIGANLDVYSPQTGLTQTQFRAQVTLYF